MGLSDFMANAERSFRGTAAALDQFGQETLAPTVEKTWEEMDRFGKEKLVLAMMKTREELHKFGKEKLGPVMKKTAEEMDSFGKEQLGPVLVRTGEDLDRFGREQLGPAMTRVGEGLDQFGKEQLEPAMAKAGEGLNYFNHQKIGPAFHTAFRATSNFAWHQLGPAVSTSVQATGDFTQHKLVPAAEKFVHEPIKENPAAATVVASSSVVIFCPWLISAPVLMILGFTPSGPATASIAAVAQSSIGNVAGGSLFAILQSAAMGGYGMFAVNAVVSSTAAMVAGTVFRDTTMKYMGKGKKEEKEKPI